MNGCNICGEEVDVNNGGCAIMLAFCRNHSTTLTNVSFCRDCYYLLIEDHLKKLNENARLHINFGKEEAND